MKGWLKDCRAWSTTRLLLLRTAVLKSSSPRTLPLIINHLSILAFSEPKHAPTTTPTHPPIHPPIHTHTQTNSLPHINLHTYKFLLPICLFSKHHSWHNAYVLLTSNCNTAVSDAAETPVFHIKTLWESSDILQLDYLWSSTCFIAV